MNKKATLSLVIACIVIVVLMVAILFSKGILIADNRNMTTIPPKLVIDPNVGPSPTPAPTAPGIAIPGWATLSLPAGMKEAEVPLVNPEANEGWYYLTFELRLKENNEIIFSTGLIPPGLYCNKVTLSKPLVKGTYECTMIVQPYFIREIPTPTNNAVFDIRVSVF